MGPSDSIARVDGREEMPKLEPHAREARLPALHRETARDERLPGDLLVEPRGHTSRDAPPPPLCELRQHGTTSSSAPGGSICANVHATIVQDRGQ